MAGQLTRILYVGDEPDIRTAAQLALAALGKLRELPQFAAMPVLSLAAKAQPGEVAAYKKIGALGALPKPSDPMTLARQIQAIWGRHHG